MYLKLHVLFTIFYLLQSSVYVILHRISFGVAYSITRFNVTREELNSKVYHLPARRDINCINSKFERRRCLVIKFSRSDAADDLMK